MPMLPRASAQSRASSSFARLRCTRKTCPQASAAFGYRMRSQHTRSHDEYRGRNVPASAGRYAANRAVEALSICLLNVTAAR
jgi:hypothetical protein